MYDLFVINTKEVVAPSSSAPDPSRADIQKASLPWSVILLL